MPILPFVLVVVVVRLSLRPGFVMEMANLARVPLGDTTAVLDGFAGSLMGERRPEFSKPGEAS